MKQLRIPLLLAAGVALISGPVASHAASDTANATAEIVVPIAINNTQDLAFGKIDAQTGGTVVIDTAGSRTKTGAVILIAAGSTQTQATFDVTGDGTATYSITLPAGSVSLSDGATHTMSVGTFTSSPSGTGTLTAGAQTINVGGTLTVASGQAAGSYTGTFTVTVEYN
jgi:hypothetical protein